MNNVTDADLIKKADQAATNISCYNTRSIGWCATEMRMMRKELNDIEEEIARRGLVYNRKEGLY